MSGKKKEKFCITLGFATNADGSEKLDIVFIGKSKTPRCWKYASKAFLAKLYYRNNKKAWMTAVLFEEYVSLLYFK